MQTNLTWRASSSSSLRRAVTYDEGFYLAKKHNMLFMECSAKNGRNIDALFTLLSEHILARIDNGEIDPRNESIGVKLGTLETERVAANSDKKACC